MTDLKISPPHTSYAPAEPAPDHAADRPSRTQSFLQGAVLGDYNESLTTSSFLGQVTTGFIPGVGQLADLRDTIKAGQNVKADYSFSIKNRWLVGATGSDQTNYTHTCNICV